MTESYDDIARRVEAADDAPDIPPPPRNPVAAAVDKAVEALGVVLLNTIVVLVIANASGRYLFSRPLVWTEEIVAGLLIWLVVIGAYLALERRQMIASGVLLERISPAARRWVSVAIHALGALTFAWIANVGWQYLDLFGGDRTPYFGFPKAFYLAALPVAAAAMALVGVIHAVGAARERTA